MITNQNVWRQLDHTVCTLMICLYVQLGIKYSKVSAYLQEYILQKYRRFTKVHKSQCAQGNCQKLLALLLYIVICI